MTKKLSARALQQSLAEITNDPASDIISTVFKRKDSAKYGELQTFLENSKFVLPPRDPKTMIYSTLGGWYKFTDPNEQAVFFSYYEAARKDGCTLDFAERQDPSRSGIFVDFDMLQESPERLFDDETLNRLLTHIGKVLAQTYDLTPLGHTPTVYISVEVKPEILPKKEEEDKYKRPVFKDGMHLRILSILVNNASKRYFMRQCKNDIRRIMSKYLNSGDVLDEHAANVPVFLYGSNRKQKPAYVLQSMWKVVINSESDVTATKQYKFFENKAKTVNVDSDDEESEEETKKPKVKQQKTRKQKQQDEICISHELSLNFERQEMSYGQISKVAVDVLESCAVDVAKFDKQIDTTENTSTHLDHLIQQDPQAEYLRKVIDILSPMRSEQYPMWIKVIWALANTSEKYKPLAEYFSKMCPAKYNQSDFDKAWKEAIRMRDEPGFKYNKINICSWAKADNPEKFEIVKGKDIEFLITQMIYDKVCKGKLGQYQEAKILDKLIGDRYAVDSEEGSKKLVCYEFVLPEDGMTCKPGEAYKWRITNEGSYLQVYISEQLFRYMRAVYNKMDKINKQEDNDDEEPKKVKSKSMWYVKVQKQFEDSISKLHQDQWKKGVIEQFKHLRHKVTSGFTATLNKDPNILGVQNGVIELHPDGTHTFIKGYHSHRISFSTNCNYVEFDPEDALTKKLLIVLRQIMPNSEPDTFNWLMHFFASSIDGAVKDQYFVTGYGDGANAKSFIVELHRNTMGDTYAVSLPVGSITAKNLSGGQATPDLWVLRYARGAFISESGLMQKINSATIKMLTGQEHIPMRGLFRDMISAKPHCIYFMITNFLMELNDTTYGCFRRMKIIHFPMQFCTDMNDYDKENPYHRIADTSLSKDFNSDPIICSRWLAILLWYRLSLYRDYKGSLANIPHPHIIHTTDTYRQTQDKVNVFINGRFIIGPKVARQSLIEAMELYIQWYISNVDSSMEAPKLKHGLQTKFLGSAVSKYIIKDATGSYFFEKGRIMKADEHPGKGEILFSTKHTIAVSEDLPKEIVNPPKYDSDSDSDDESDKKKSKKKESKEDDYEEKTVPVDGFDKNVEGKKFKEEAKIASQEVLLVKPETSEEYYARIVSEWKAWKTRKEVPVIDEEKKEMLIIEQNMIKDSIIQDHNEYMRMREEKMKSNTWSFRGKKFDPDRMMDDPSLCEIDMSKEELKYIIEGM